MRYEPAYRAWLAALARTVSRRRWAEVFPVTPATLPGLAPEAGREEVGHDRAAQPRPSSDHPQYQATRIAPGAREPAVGAPPDSGRTGQARHCRGAFCRLGDPARRGHRSGAPPGRPWLGGVPAAAGMAGNSFPGLFTVGSYRRHGKWTFWVVHDPKQAVLITLRDARYSQLVIDVDDPQATIALVNGALNGRGLREQ